MIRLLAGLLSFTVIGIGPLLAQTPNLDVIFDDFSYRSTNWGSELDEGWNPTSAPNSVYGRTKWSTPSGERNQRLWYRYFWQESASTDPQWDLSADPSSSGRLTFSIDGREQPYAADGIDGRLPQQIVTGFAARRGTWAARVTFGDLAPAAQSALIQAFWLISPYSFFINNKRRKEWSEVDVEWNNHFNGKTQQNPYLRTGHTAGEGPIEGPLYAPPRPQQQRTAPKAYAWSCANSTIVLSEEECSSLITETPVVILIQVSDSGVRYEIQAGDGSNRIFARSQQISPPPSHPMVAVFSQHVSQESTVSSTERFSVDWFYYSPDPEVSVQTIFSDVALLRATRIPRYLGRPAFTLERPDHYLDGNAASYGLAHVSTPLALDRSHLPSSLAPGATARLTVLPPLRHGFFRLTWHYRCHFNSGRLSKWKPLTPGSFPGTADVAFTFPRRRTVDYVELRILLEELKSPEEPVPLTPSFSSPKTEYAIIRRGTR